MHQSKSTLYPVSLLLFLVFNLFILGCHSGQETKKQTEFRAGSYNIRYDAKADIKSGNGWEIRKIPVSKIILSHDFDIFGTQEGRVYQLEELNDLLKDYKYTSHPYGGPEGNSSNLAIFYKPSKFAILDSGYFWLSQTPDQESIGWDGQDTRMCQWLKLKTNDAGKEFFFFNLHNHWGKQVKDAKYNGVILAKEKIESISNGLPAICTGDFNSDDQSAQIKKMSESMQEAYEAAQTAPQESFNTAFEGGVFEGKPLVRIDFIFLTKQFTVLDYLASEETYGENRFPSDHLPITSLVSF